MSYTDPQIADLYEKLNQFRQSAEWFMQLQGLLPTDPGCLKRIGEIYDHDFQDKVRTIFRFSSVFKKL